MPSGVSPGWMMRAVMPSAQAEALTEEGVRLRLVMGEVALAELVLDQPVGGGGVRHAQQRLGQHHQGEPLLGGERVLPQHLLDAAEPAAVGADRLDRGRARAASIRALALGRERAPRSSRRAMATSSSA